jgi:hypothetical protein
MSTVTASFADDCLVVSLIVQVTPRAALSSPGGMITDEAQVVYVDGMLMPTQLVWVRSQECLALIIRLW